MLFANGLKMWIMSFVPLLITLLYDTGGQYVPLGLEDELEALQRNDFAAYAAIHGLNLTYHEAVTPDGWILQLWRVRSLKIFDVKLSTPVIVSHGFGSSSFDYVRDLRNQSTAFILADNGYDVWMPNFRANQFSNLILSKGKRRRPKPAEYYRAAWQYMAEYDLPTTIDTVLGSTRQSKFYLIGHSMGTTIPFAFLSQNHSYDTKLLHFAAVVPVLKFGNDTSPQIQTALRAAPPTARALPQPAFGVVFGTQLAASSGDRIATLQSLLQSTVCFFAGPLCELLTDLLFDRDLVTALKTDSHLNETRSAIYFSKTPGGVTMMTVYNFGQEWNKDPWTKIDFRDLYQTGLTNEGEYNTVDPPEFDFGALEVPFSLFYVNNDVFTGTQTARKVIAELRATDFKFINGRNLSHVDAVVGIDARCYSLNDIMSKFESLENKRDGAHKEYRRKVRTFVNSLPFQDGCLDSGR